MIKLKLFPYSSTLYFDLTVHMSTEDIVSLTHGLGLNGATPDGSSTLRT